MRKKDATDAYATQHEKQLQQNAVLSSSPSPSISSIESELLIFNGDPNTCRPPLIFTAEKSTLADFESSGEDSSGSMEGYFPDNVEDATSYHQAGAFRPITKTDVDEQTPDAVDNQQGWLGVVASTIGDASAGTEPSLPLTTTTSTTIVEEDTVVVEKDNELEPVKPNNDNDKEDGDERPLDTSTQNIIDSYQEYVLESIENSQKESSAASNLHSDTETTPPSVSNNNVNNTRAPPIRPENKDSRPSMKFQPVTCQLCDSYASVKPVKVRSPYALKAYMNSSAYNNLYVCLSGVHMRKTGECWSLTDGCTPQTWSNDEWTDIVNAPKAIDMCLGGHDLVFVPSGKGKGCWFVRQIESTGEEVAEPEQVPIEVPIKPPGNDIKDTESDDRIIDSLIDDSTEHEIMTDKDQAKPSPPTPSPPTSIEKNRLSLKEAREKVKGTFVKTIKSVPDIIKKGEQILDNLLDENENDYTTTTTAPASVLPDEFVEVGDKYLKPLKSIVFDICTRMGSVRLSEQRSLGDDFVNVDIGWQIRGEFCTLIAQILRIGLLEQRSTLMSFFTEQTPTTLWDVVKEFSLAYRLREFNAVVQAIENARRLRSDDERFRAFICELLNRSKEDGTEKLIVLFFQMFPFATGKLRRFYAEGSFWRMTYNSGFGVILDDFILSMKHFNGWPFNLHIAFEERFLPAAQRTEVVTNSNGDDDQFYF